MVTIKEGIFLQDRGLNKLIYHYNYLFLFGIFCKTICTNKPFLIELRNFLQM